MSCLIVVNLRISDWLFMLRTLRCFLKLSVLCLLLTPGCLATAKADPTDLALSAFATATSTRSEQYAASNAIDGKLSNDSRWLSDPKMTGSQTLTISFKASQTIGCLQIATGWFDGTNWVEPAPDFHFEYRSASSWIQIPGASVHGNTANVVEFRPDTPIATDSVRLVINGPKEAKVVEVRMYESSDSYPPLVLPVNGDEANHSVRLPSVFVNQVGYDLDGAKRFTVPGAPDGAPFTIRPASGGSDLFHGNIHGKIGDLTAFNPSAKNARYVIETSTGVSDSFAIGPKLFENACLRPALDFMIDDRSVVGTHPSAYGGCPWRDGTYYSYEIPSLVMLYLADSAYFDSLPNEIDTAADKARFFSQGFSITKEPSDSGVLDAVRSYYTNIDPPSPSAPDIIKLIHWGIGWYLVKPASIDPSGDPAGNIVHPQTVEQFAFFLYAYPLMAKYFSPKFFKMANDFAYDEWHKVGLLDVNETVGDWKGREAVGHSILPNLLMYQVAMREKRSDADVYLNAAVKEADWIVSNVDPADPRISKGQRMSEHKTFTALAALQHSYPQSAPKGLKRWLSAWADAIIARSDNLWDFCKYDDQNWSLPPLPTGSVMNDVGSVIALPACALAVADVLDDKSKARRLREVATAQFDVLFGRNPVGASAAWRGPTDYPGVVRGWPYESNGNGCARLALVRGTLSSSPDSEQFPNNPKGIFSYSEGWTAYNAAFNVSLAYALKDPCEIFKLK